MRPDFRFLSDGQRERVAGAAFDILENVGVELTEPDAREMLHGAGAQIEGQRVRLPTHLIQDAIDSAPSHIGIYARDGEPAFVLGGSRSYFGAHTDAPDVLDPLTGRRRPCKEADVSCHAALIDQLPNLRFTTASGMVADRRPEIADRVSLAQCLIHSAKPVLAMPVTPEAVADCRDMAALAVGGEAALRHRPVLIVYAEPVSPLVHPEASVRKLLACARDEIPLVYTPYAAMGATAPLSPLGAVAQLCAESLSGLVVHQLRRPGAPFIFGGMASVMDMRTTIFSYGAPEFQRGNTLMVEMAHYFDLPNFGTAGTSDAQTFDGQAVLEACSSCLMALLVGANLVHDVGLMGNATVVMPAMIMATDEIIAMLQHLLAENVVDSEALAIDVIEEVGPGGEFVTHAHTYGHFREVWYPDLSFRAGAEAWAAGERDVFEERVTARTCELMEKGDGESVAEDVAEAIDEVVMRAEAALPT
ncbi:MAG: trimethylamine methyltransferase family protein [Anaerolineae bacterium]